MSPWDVHASIATYLTFEDISHAAATLDTQQYATPVLKLVSEARAKGYDVICLPLTTDKWKQRWAEMCVQLQDDSERERDTVAERRAEEWRARPAFLKDEVTITRLDEAEGITAMISEWLELDAADDWVRHDAEIALRQEIAYASYLNIQTVILPAPRSRFHVASYARIISACLETTTFLNLSVRLPIYNPSVLRQESPVPTASQSSLIEPASASDVPMILLPSNTTQNLSSAPEGELNATWEMWDVIRSMCGYDTRLSLTLDLTPPLPTTLGVLSKWTAESVRHIYIPASTFIANTKGYPVLPKPTQTFIRNSMIASLSSPTIILSDVVSGLHNRGGEAAYSQYVRHLEKTSLAVQASQKPGTVENFAQGYQDYLQAPLQPLMDNLQSLTYQTFEQDPIKYTQYEEAIFKALLEWQPTSERIICCVAGAGRGPLVARCLSAITRAKRDVFIYAVEKNPNAFVTLQERQEKEWGDSVKILFGDMRYIDIPEQADILISELLGSFGDNELSPECLDGAMRFLKPTGVSIPSSYTAHLAPLSSSKLYNEARSSKDGKSLETPYVVMFQAVNILSGDGGGLRGQCGPQIQECWEFEHPRRDIVLDLRGLPLTNTHNVRAAHLNFYIPHAGVLHGLAGYFEAVLYGNIGLSIHPHRKDRISKDMLSWFPLFFPFKETLYLPSNSELRVSIWRLTNERHVWYEWHAESFLTMPTSSIAPTSPTLMGYRYSPSPSSSGLFSPSAPSPLIDAAEPVFKFPEPRASTSSIETVGVAYDVVKIGHTSLHNPGGRSSWIGL
ncbi:hypothetical protein AMATHDRAFT_138418 [Amanita thiersii Skay4041]|uniref:Protein arginine N-methyltransferase n=1 Tax=Amanita thiersii Skay4041 TaxID=703135 RepID=A0A2A9NSG4_9AGAR|nr:hypothetical protein AMATHDRAFT_138418 [Amanita thiersii Skay4041]